MLLIIINSYMYNYINIIIIIIIIYVCRRQISSYKKNSATITV